ncbi:pyruvate, water dikinase regulatory protein [Echinicola sediminis]
MSVYHIYIASDSINFLGAESIAQLAAASFSDRECKIIKIPNVKSSEKALETVLAAKENQPSLVVFTTSLVEVRDTFLIDGLKHRVQCFDLLSPLVKALGNVLKTPPVYRQGYSWQLDDAYFQKISALEFAINNDDGRSLSSLQKADIVLIGVSRTSKTPLSIYLAYHNYLVVNIPLVSEKNVPPHLYQLSSKKVIGLTISPRRLNQIRAERTTNMGLIGESPYSDMNRIIEELEFADRVMKKIGCPVIDVSNRAIEETAETIMKLTNKPNIQNHE